MDWIFAELATRFQELATVSKMVASDDPRSAQIPTEMKRVLIEAFQTAETAMDRLQEQRSAIRRELHELERSLPNITTLARAVEGQAPGVFGDSLGSLEQLLKQTVKQVDSGEASPEGWRGTCCTWVNTAFVRLLRYLLERCEIRWPTASTHEQLLLLQHHLRRSQCFFELHHALNHGPDLSIHDLQEVLHHFQSVLSATWASLTEGRLGKYAGKDAGKYKTMLCRNWVSTGSCRHGEACKFAHGREELRTRQ